MKLKLRKDVLLKQHFIYHQHIIFLLGIRAWAWALGTENNSTWTNNKKLEKSRTTHTRLESIEEMRNNDKVTFKIINKEDL